ncbi:MAG: D-tyrosyl-tRNA(Tyr) deacylase [Amoebophilaceae bacterium TMED152]|nr:MAG: D-tyrosyl-tRNA(Tyr) deacylase [Amoebophilaceae bacterium TMED152]|tara:strand:+ start:7326 stop:7778 length:453 start_codon:yes stop_codon:yes gene_type:complete
MRIVVQRVSQSNVEVSGEVIGEIMEGLMVLVSFVDEDNDTDLDWMTKKIINLRIFNDDEGKMNRSVQEVAGDILLISQFTLHGSTKKGNRPSFIKAAKPDFANVMYERFIKVLERSLGKEIQTGEFGGDMKVSLVNDGPTTIIIDSRNKE